MGLFGDLGGGLFGGIAGLMSDDGSGDAADYYKQLAAKTGNANPTMNVKSDRRPEQDVLRNLQGIYSSGGLDAIGKSRIAQSEAESNRNATARGNSILEGARQRGAGNSAAALALQQQSGEDANNRVALDASNAAAIGEGTRMAALSGAGQVGGHIADAQDAVSKFNQMGTFQNKMQQAGMQSDIYGNAYGAQRNEDQRNRAIASGWGNTLGGIADYFDPKKPGG